MTQVVADSNGIEGPPDPLAEYKNELRRRAYLIIGLFLMLLIGMVGGGYGIYQLLDIGKDTKDSVEILRDATSPAAQDRQANVVRELVISVDCNFRGSLQEFSDALEAQGIIAHITLVTPDCSARE